MQSPSSHGLLSADEPLRDDIRLGDLDSPQVQGHKLEEKAKDSYDLLFVWLAPLFMLASTRPLEQNDFTLLPSECNCKDNGDILKEEWDKAKNIENATMNKSGGIGERRSLLSALIKIYGTEYAWIGCYLAASTILSFLGPLLLANLVDCASEEKPPLGLISFYVALLTLSKVAVAILNTQYVFRSGKIVLSVTAGIKSCIFQKMLRLSTSSRRQYEIGKLTNLYTVDVDRVVNVAISLHNIWALPLQIFVCMFLLFRAVSYATFAGLAAILILLLINNYISLLQRKANDSLMEAKDERLKVSGEVFKNILNIKFCAWEEYFLGKIFEKRQVELQWVWRCAYLVAINIFLLWMAPQCISTTTIVVFAEVMKADITGAKIFSAIALFRMLQDPLRSLPSLITQFYQAQSSLHRLSLFYSMIDKEHKECGCDIFVPCSCKCSCLSDSELDSSDTNNGTSTKSRGSVFLCGSQGYSWASPEGDLNERAQDRNNRGNKYESDDNERSSKVGSIDPSHRFSIIGDTDGDEHEGVDTDTDDGNDDTTTEISFSSSNSSGSSTTDGMGKNSFTSSNSSRDSVTDDDTENTLHSTHGLQGDDVSSGGSHAVYIQVASTNEDNEITKKPSKRRAGASHNMGQSSSILSYIVEQVHSWKHQFLVLLGIDSVFKSKVDEEPEVFFTNFRLSIPANVYVSPGQLVVIKGQVGSGKSSLVAALLGEMYRKDQLHSNKSNDNGTQITTSETNFTHAHGSIAYASQQSWIQNASVKENVLFGLPFDASKYAKVVDACALQQDFDELPFGDDTQIGENAINISGGQKARVAFARACYADADILIADDVLAALDSIVAKKVFQSVFLDLCKHKTRLLISHNVDAISHPQVDILLSVNDGVVNVIETDKEKKRAQGDRDSDQNSKMNPSLSNKVEPDPNLSPDENDKTIATSSVQLVTQRQAASFNAQEDRAVGQIDKKVYLFYLDALGGIIPIAFLLVVQSIWQSLSISADLYLSRWSQESDREQQSNLTHNVLIYAAFSLGSGLMVLVRTMCISLIGFRAAKTMFEKMITALIHAPMNWHDVNPSGRLLNRMSTDQARIDGELPIAVGSILATGFSVCGDLITVMTVTKLLIFLVTPAFIVYFHIMNVYLRASRELKRLTSVSQSPTLTLLSECIHGTVLLRAFGKETMDRFVAGNEKLIDENNNMLFLSTAASAWFVLRIQIIGAFILLCVCICALFLGRFLGLTPGLVGLSISYGLNVSNGLIGLIGTLSWFEMTMVSPERVQQYIHVEAEGTEQQKMLYRLGNKKEEQDKDKDKDKDDAASQEVMSASSISPLHGNGTLPGTVAGSAAAVDAAVNNAGDIEMSLRKPTPSAYIAFQDVYFKYQPSGDTVLCGVTFDIKRGEKIGIVGRTGSGKSTISMALFRIAELCGGTIYLDGKDISTMPLAELRKSIEMVPQNPVVYKGTVHSFLDPLGEYSDFDIAQALEKIGMSNVLVKMTKENVTVGQSAGSCIDYLHANIEENGENLSVGERQMLVLSRALLHDANVLVMDEATASIDAQTCHRLQKVIHDNFTHCTCLTVAHRIDTIINADRILVMDAGRALEFDSPVNLLNNPDSSFRKLWLSQQSSY